MNFNFIDDYVFSLGTHRLDKEFQSGCDCRPDNGRQMGCEYLYCDCLEDAAKDDFGNPRGFPYYATAPRKGCLREFYLDSRYPIYECNELCTCRDNCKNKVVQKGRQIPLEIFKTGNRGFGILLPSCHFVFIAHSIKGYALLSIFERVSSLTPTAERSSRTLRQPFEKLGLIKGRTLTFIALTSFVVRKVIMTSYRTRNYTLSMESSWEDQQDS